MARIEEVPVIEAEDVTEPLRPVQVVVAYDFSPSSEHALARAIEVAARAPQHVLHIASILEPRDHATYETADRLRDAIVERVAAAFAERETAAEVRFYVHARLGSPATEILGLAAEVGADLIFIGSHGRTGLERALLGSISERVVREAQCPVMVVRLKTYRDVELLNVTPYDHARAPHREPHAYSYSNRRVVLRPADWPIL